MVCKMRSRLCMDLYSSYDTGLDKMFHFTCFNVDPEDDPSVGLINGELAIPGNLLRREVFDPVVNQVSFLIM